MEKYSIELTRDELVRVIEGLGLLMDEAQEEQDKKSVITLVYFVASCSRLQTASLPSSAVTRSLSRQEKSLTKSLKQSARTI